VENKVRGEKRKRAVAVDFCCSTCTNKNARKDEWSISAIELLPQTHTNTHSNSPANSGKSTSVCAGEWYLCEADTATNKKVTLKLQR